MRNFSHSVMMYFDLNTLNEIPTLLLIKIFILNGSLSLTAAYYFRIYGFLAAVFIHFLTDLVWQYYGGQLPKIFLNIYNDQSINKPILQEI